MAAIVTKVEEVNAAFWDTTEQDQNASLKESNAQIQQISSLQVDVSTVTSSSSSSSATRAIRQAETAPVESPALLESSPPRKPARLPRVRAFPPTARLQQLGDTREARASPGGPTTDQVSVSPSKYANSQRAESLPAGERRSSRKFTSSIGVNASSNQPTHVQPRRSTRRKDVTSDPDTVAEDRMESQ